ncbi:hypothetical protein [Bradyrhizobium sp. USDA 4353]
MIGQILDESASRLRGMADDAALHDGSQILMKLGFNYTPGNIRARMIPRKRGRTFTARQSA